MPYRIEEIFDGRNTKYVVKIGHKELGKSRVISGTDEYIVDQKARAQVDSWEALWKKKVQKERAIKERQEQKDRSILEKQTQKEKSAAQKQSKIDEAERQTIDAEKALESIQNTLLYTLSVNDRIDWESIKDKKAFNKPMPTFLKPKEPDLPPRPVSPTQPVADPVPDEPKETDVKYKPSIGFWTKFSPTRKKEKFEAAKRLFVADHTRWQKQRDDVLNDYRLRKDKWEAELKSIEEEYVRTIDRVKKAYELKVQRDRDSYDASIQAWSKEKNEYLLIQKSKNEAIEKRKTDYFEKLPDAIIDYCDLVLSGSRYPDGFPQEFELDYNAETKLLIIDYSLPRPEDVPRMKEVKYFSNRDEFKKIYISENEANRIYDSLIYQIALRSIHELFEADAVEALDCTVFNGWVTFIDKGTGKETTACIISLHVIKDEFLTINLGNVDPKDCFKRLKGVGSSKLFGLTPIAPLMQVDRKDKRFIASQNVIHKLEEGSNLATMEWEEFEHLVRELFEKEFFSANGEVKITQASKDGGVDAVVFDPDPIRGGKIIIQAKRYTNTVNVSAVRDLYGTVVNEGAIKGILITTADFGPDSYNFSKDKPLTLLNGSNLLYLLQKNGYKARIDLAEAKKLLFEKQRQQGL